MKCIIAVTDSVEKKISYFALKNEQWPFDRLQAEFNKTHSLRGNFRPFVDFIVARGAVEIELPTLDLASYPDPDW